MNRIIVTELKQTCGACPSQWEGRTADGRYLYVRYRWGHLQVGIGTTLREAINNEFISGKLGDSYDGVLAYPDLVAVTGDMISWRLGDDDALGHKA